MFKKLGRGKCSNKKEKILGWKGGGSEIEKNKKVLCFPRKIPATWGERPHSQKSKTWHPHMESSRGKDSKKKGR